MEVLVKAGFDFWRGRSVFVTGHTGFKGGWLALWLDGLGAQTHGYSLNPPTHPALFDVARLESIFASDTRADVADLPAMKAAMTAAQPEVVFHLAAQPLVRESYRNPLATLQTNINGTAHVLEAARDCPSIRAIVLVTTDKVYENREWPYPYREADALGGHDPYSASKAAAELVAASYRVSFFAENAASARVATARAGNVIGGGDWATDRLLPDCIGSFAASHPVRIRFPDAVRPWQHVLEPIAGYLRLGERLTGGDGHSFAKAWNFGPDAAGDASVGDIARMVADSWGGSARIEEAASGTDPHEAGMLRLDSTAARTLLGWRPRWTLREAVDHTVQWYRAWHSGCDMSEFSRAQIRSYQEACIQ